MGATDDWTLTAQIELHPYNPEHELKKYCESEGILLQAYSPLGSTRTSPSCDGYVSRLGRRGHRPTGSLQCIQSPR